MEAKEFFQSVLDAQRAIYAIREKQEHYTEMATGMSGMSETNIRSSSRRSRVEAAAVGLVDLSDKLDKEAEKYLARIRQAEQIIQKLEKPRHRQVLTLRYLAGHSWRTVADEMDYKDIKSAFRVHGWALMEAQKFL